MFDGFFAHNHCRGKDTNAPVHHHGPRWNCFENLLASTRPTKWISLSLKWCVWKGGIYLLLGNRSSDVWLFVKRWRRSCCAWVSRPILFTIHRRKAAKPCHESKLPLNLAICCPEEPSVILVVDDIVKNACTVITFCFVRYYKRPKRWNPERWKFDEIWIYDIMWCNIVILHVKLWGCRFCWGSDRAFLWTSTTAKLMHICRFRCRWKKIPIENTYG